jgi:NDP-sugar pyrophosphorylase family protein
MRLIPLLILLTAGLASAGETTLDCSLKADPDDRISKGKSLEVKAGEILKDAVVLDGDLVVRRGASVKSAVAVHGTVTIEDGATVRGSVVALGGKLRVGPKASVQGSRISLDDGLHVVGEDGGSFDVGISMGGEPLGKKLMAEVLKDVRACRVETK